MENEVVMTLTIPDELARRLQPFEPQLAEILELGIREWNTRHSEGFHGMREVLEKLATLPAPEEVLALQPSPELQKRVADLLEKNRGSGLSEDEQKEWDGYQYLEHLVRMAKGRAHSKLNGK